LGRNFGSNRVLHGPDGVMYVSGGSFQIYDENGVASPTTALLYELSADGRTCGIFRWETGENDPHQLIATGDGAFFFGSWNGFGRLER
jgi:hypothetical protein